MNVKDILKKMPKPIRYLATPLIILVVSVALFFGDDNEEF